MDVLLPRVKEKNIQYIKQNLCTASCPQKAFEKKIKELFS